MCRCGLAPLPVFLVTSTLATFCVTYIISITRGDVPVFLPYISDTGTKAPESCIFSFFLNITVALGLCTMFVRYKIVRGLPTESERSIRCLNIATLAVGTLSLLGLCIVANFQEKAVESVHTTGAAMTFIFGTIYICLQTKMSYMLVPECCDVSLSKTRLVISLLCLTSAICLFVGKIVSSLQKDVHHGIKPWSSGDKGYAAHLTGTIAEWLTTITFVLFFSTYVQEFKASSIDIHVHLSPAYERLALRV